MSPKPSLRILLVEDNPDHALLAKNAILSSKDCKYLVETCGSVEEAMEKIKGDQINMVVSDYNLPGKNGLDFLEWLNAENINVPFIMMTGMGDEKTAVRAMQDGAYNYIVKDDVYLNVLPHVVDETFLKYLAEQEKARYELEIREKNAALEKANRELKKLDQLKSDFIASVSHDIRTPLNSVQESIALILDGIVDTHQDNGKNVLEIAKRSIQRLTTMINDLLDFSKLEAGKMRLHIEPSDVQVLIDEVLSSLKSLAEKKKVKFVFNPTQGFPKVPCDPERMVQVLINLVGNAIKFTPEGGAVTVQTEATAQGRVNISVQDTGIGIAKEDLGRIFERFEQVKDANPKGTKGTGLGLSICKELIRLHGGEIYVESEPGKGSRFIISLSIQNDLKEKNVSLAQERINT
ncbi:MAG: hybrid sensor histidine kinase/response regulator [Candidatus Omnitrophica bacterium]|nr:hybrid sensor histidine kinase/response regulator [Candidatus Omnitrophota bacterium]